MSSLHGISIAQRDHAVAGGMKLCSSLLVSAFALGQAKCQMGLKHLLMALTVKKAIIHHLFLTVSNHASSSCFQLSAQFETRRVSSSKRCLQQQLQKQRALKFSCKKCQMTLLHEQDFKKSQSFANHITTASEIPQFVCHQIQRKRKSGFVIFKFLRSIKGFQNPDPGKVEDTLRSFFHQEITFEEKQEQQSNSLAVSSTFAFLKLIEFQTTRCQWLKC